MSATKSLSVVVFREGPFWLAQVLEKDICVQGDDLVDTLRRLSLMLRLEVEEDDFDALPPAPAYFQVLWPARSGLLTPHETPFADLGFDVSIAIVA
jgi:hypothetical protein